MLKYLVIGLLLVTSSSSLKSQTIEVDSIKNIVSRHLLKDYDLKHTVLDKFFIQEQITLVIKDSTFNGHNKTYYTIGFKDNWLKQTTTIVVIYDPTGQIVEILGTELDFVEFISIYEFAVFLETVASKQIFNELASWCLWKKWKYDVANDVYKVKDKLLGRIRGKSGFYSFNLKGNKKYLRQKYHWVEYYCSVTFISGEYEYIQSGSSVWNDNVYIRLSDFQVDLNNYTIAIRLSASTELPGHIGFKNRDDKGWYTIEHNRLIYYDFKRKMILNDKLEFRSRKLLTDI